MLDACPDSDPRPPAEPEALFPVSAPLNEPVPLLENWSFGALAELALLPPPVALPLLALLLALVPLAPLVWLAAG